MPHLIVFRVGHFVASCHPAHAILRASQNGRMRQRPSSRLLLTLLFAAFAATSPASARIGLVVGEPFGSFGTMMPVGHAGIYLDHVCAETPTQLRACRPGESGVVISRYHDLRTLNLDWMAVPAFTFFYGVKTADEVPTFVTPSAEAELRESYRQAHLLSVVPDRIDKHGVAHRPAYGDWEEAIGAAFDRKLFVYTLDTTPEQDAAVIAYLNSQPNERRYTLGRNNCADFAKNILALVLPADQPSALRRNVVADFDMTTPKNLARDLDAYGKTHPEANLIAYEIPQLPGTLRRSRPLRGAAETFVKTKRYLFTLLVLQPELLLTDWILYQSKGRWKPGLDATTVQAGQLPQPMENAYSPASTSSSTASEANGFRAK